MNENILEKKNCLITGATGGLGKQIAIELAKKNCNLFLTSMEENLEELKQELEKQNNKIVIKYQHSDLRKDEDVNNLIRKIRGEFTPIDILINCAGENHRRSLSESTLDEFDSCMNLNARAPFLLCKEFSGDMTEKKWGRIVNIASIWSQKSKEHRASYSASKFGLDGITAALSVELAEYGILANSVSPGFVDTDLTRKILGDVGIKEIQKRIPIKRLGKVEEIAELVCWLASDSNSYLSGQNIVIDGGFVRA